MKGQIVIRQGDPTSDFVYVKQVVVKLFENKSYGWLVLNMIEVTLFRSKRLGCC